MSTILPVLVLIQLHQRCSNLLRLRRSRVGVACFCGLVCCLDQTASDYIYSSGDALEPNVSVNSIAVPEPSSTTELLMFGALALGYRWHNRKVRSTK